jgi:hypothetical protein
MGIGSEAYIQAKKLPNGKWRLYYRGTRNEVFPGKLFQSTQEARNYFRIQKIKHESLNTNCSIFDDSLKALDTIIDGSFK